MMGETEARIRRLSARLNQLENRTSNVQDKILRDRQALGMFRQNSWNQRCTTTVNGTIFGGVGTTTLVANCSVDIVGHVSGEFYGTFAATAGSFSAALQLDPADTSLDITVTGPGIRFTTGSPVNRTLTQCSTNTLTPIQATPAPGYNYATNGAFGGNLLCLLPIADALNYSSAILGTGTLTQGVDLCIPWTSRTTISCPGGVASALNLSYNNGPTFLLTYFAGAGGGGVCPVPKTCPATGSQRNALGLSNTPTRTCPIDPTVATGWSMTFTFNNNPDGTEMFPAGTFSITLFE